MLNFTDDIREPVSLLNVLSLLSHVFYLLSRVSLSSIILSVSPFLRFPSLSHVSVAMFSVASPGHLQKSSYFKRFEQNEFKLLLKSFKNLLHIF